MKKSKRTGAMLKSMLGFLCESVEVVDLPAGTFKRSGTMVASKLLLIMKK
jgi:hypothetical protein